jgi:hypothetical protein
MAGSYYKEILLKMARTEIVWILLLVVLLLALGILWLIRVIAADRRRRKIATIVHRDRSNRIRRSLRHQIAEPEYPGLSRPEHRSQKSTNENSPEFHRVLKDLRFTHFYRSEAWRWEEAHRILKRKRADLTEELVKLLQGDRAAAQRLIRGAGSVERAIEELLRDRL